MVLTAVVVVAAILHLKSNYRATSLLGFWRLEAVSFVFSMAFIIVSLVTRQGIA